MQMIRLQPTSQTRGLTIVAALLSAACICAGLGCGARPNRIAAGAEAEPVLPGSETDRVPVSDEAEGFLARKERWAIKTGADPDAPRVKLDRPAEAKVGRLIWFPRPRELPENATSRAAQVTRYGSAERTLYVIDADIVRFKLEKDDHDLHIVIRDHGDTHAEDAPADSGRRRTIIVEIPDPSVVAASSPWRAAIARARRTFIERFHPQPRFDYQVVHARVTGVGYFDYMHGQSGVAPNGIELHPVLKMEFPDDAIAGGRQPLRAHRTPAAETGRNGSTSGKVWVNIRSGVYWRPGTEYYGKTKHGQYMTEKEALAAGYHAAEGQ